MTRLILTPPLVFALIAGLSPLCAPPSVGYLPTATVLTLEGARLVPGVEAPWNAAATDGPICQNADTCTQVEYLSAFSSLGALQGANALNRALETTSGEKVVFGYSLGALAATQWIVQHADNTDAPDPDEVSFVLYGNPARPHTAAGKWIGAVTTPDTQYHVTDVTRQYDGVSDFPQNPLNLVAVANAAAGVLFIHLDYVDVDVENPTPGTVTWTEPDSNYTYVFIPTENLPLLEPLRIVGLDGLADKLNDPLKDVVEAGYDRDIPDTASVTPSSFAMTSTDADQKTAAEPDHRRPVISGLGGPRHALAGTAPMVDELGEGVVKALRTFNTTKKIPANRHSVDSAQDQGGAARWTPKPDLASRLGDHFRSSEGLHRKRQ